MPATYLFTSRTRTARTLFLKMNEWIMNDDKWYGNVIIGSWIMMWMMDGRSSVGVHRMVGRMIRRGRKKMDQMNG